MSKSKTSQAIGRAFMTLERACDPSREASDLLRKAFEAALEGERQHRKGAPYCVSHEARISSQDAARFFVLKWVCEGSPKKVSFREAAQLRPDAFLGYALRCYLDEEKRYPFETTPEAANFDYSVITWGEKA